MPKPPRTNPKAKRTRPNTTFWMDVRFLIVLSLLCYREGEEERVGELSSPMWPLESDDDDSLTFEMMPAASTCSKSCLFATRSYGTLFQGISPV